MKIVVYDIAVSDGGGKTILKQYIDKAKKDTNNQWWFIISLPDFVNDETENVHILYQPELNRMGVRRWLNRFVFEQTKLKKMVSSIMPDRVLSLQNMTMPKAKCPQTVYLHQSLQFAPVKFSFLKKNERSLAIRQRIICRLIRRKLRNADEIIVQTNWMRAATAKWTGVQENKIRVEKPLMPNDLQRADMSAAKRERIFFYPANAAVYKNHQVIVEACSILKNQGICDYRIEFTLNPSANEHVKLLYKKVQQQQLPVYFVGYLNKDSMCEKYASSTLLFPSYIETFGLPLQEAQVFGANIIASDCAYAREVLDGYKTCNFVPWNDASAWARAIHSGMK